MALTQQQTVDYLYDTFLQASREPDLRLTNATEAELIAHMEGWDNGNFAAAVIKVAQRHAQPTKKNLMRRLFSQ